MSRPSKDDSQQLGRIELASMDLADMDTSLDILELRLRQIDHRIGSGLIELVSGALSELDRLRKRRNRAHELVGDVLRDSQQRRTGKAKRDGG